MDFQKMTEQILELGKVNINNVPVSDTERDIYGESQMDEEDDDGDMSSILGQETSSTKNTRDSNESVNTNSTSSRHLVVDGQKYYVAGSVLLFTKMLTDYMQCIDNVPSLATDILHRIFEILKVQIPLDYLYINKILLFFKAVQFTSLSSNFRGRGNQICRTKKHQCWSYWYFPNIVLFSHNYSII